MPHPAYNPYHKFWNVHGGKRCDICFGLEDDQFHATNAQSTTASPTYPVEGATSKEPDAEQSPESVPPPWMQKSVPGGD
jgi:hypothetical protein